MLILIENAFNTEINRQYILFLNGFKYSSYFELS